MKQRPAPTTARLDRAFSYANELHQNQLRKETSVPYIAHLMAVCSLVLEDGGDEEEAIAALLHDAVEDQGGRNTLEEVRRLFGERVAMIVEGCTDAFSSPKPPWLERKQRYLAHLATAPPEVLRVSLADKLHNARSILTDLRADGDSIWDRFNGGREGTLWYYRSLAELFQNISSSPMAIELVRTVHRMDRLARSIDQKK